jgi:hypothetical protein
MTTTSPALANLQSQWHALHDLDRAQAVSAIKQSGISTRKIAEFLGFGESLLRRLLLALQAPPEDRYLARQGKLSTNELVRRSKATGIRRTAKQRESLQLDRTQASIRGCRAICEWLGGEGISGPSGVQIVGEARTTLAIAEHNKKLPPDAAPPGMPVTEIIQRCRPAELKTDAINDVAWFGHWLSLWAAYSMTDSWVRYKAIELALEKQHRR